MARDANLLPLLPDMNRTSARTTVFIAGSIKIKHFAPGSRAYFTAKDLAMAEAADYGLMMWDATSTGTLKQRD